MILGDKRLNELADAGCINADHIGCASVDLRLGDSYKTISDGRVIILGEPVRYDDFTEDEFVLNPGQFCLATTLETVKLPKDIAAYVHGRSSIGRIGLVVQNAGYVDPGFFGAITLELLNESPCPIVLKKGYRVAQLVFHTCDGVSVGYKGKYNGQLAATESRMEQDKENSR